jgi:DNA-binding LytR/AlgR family response regulator
LVVASVSALRVLARRLSSCPEVGGLLLAPDAAQALRLVTSRAVDVAFVQVELRRIDGFSLVQLLRRFAPPLAVVFVSDDRSRALKAFDVGAVDFVSPGAGEERLARSLSRVPAASRRVGGPPVPWLAKPVAASAAPGRAVVSEGAVAQARWLEAVGGEYVRAHAAGGSALVGGTLDAVVSAWSDQGLVRIHRSYAARLAAVAELRRYGRGFRVVVDGRELPVSRRHAPRVRELLRHGAGIEARRCAGDGRGDSDR